MTTVLVPVGHQIEASRAMTRVVGLIKTDEDRVVVLHVHEVGEGPDGRPVDEEPDDRCIAGIVGRTLRQAGIEADWVTATAPYGQLVATIATVAGQEQADIVVVGDDPTWLSTHVPVRVELEGLLPGVRVVGVR